MKKIPYRRIMGRNCISELLKSAPERIVEVYTCMRDPDDALYRQLERAGIKINHMHKQDLAKLVDSDSHQSFVAAVKEGASVEIKQFLKQDRDHSLVLMLDSIFDPQNLGALLRAAECYGVDLVLFSKNRGAEVTPVATKASVGASELVPIAKVSNLADTVKAFQKAGYWAVTADGGEQAESLYSFSFPEKTLLIMGSEGKGVQPLLKKNCDFLVKIPMLGQIDSLNVSQATAVFLDGYSRQVHLS